MRINFHMMKKFNYNDQILATRVDLDEDNTLTFGGQLCKNSRDRNIRYLDQI